MGRAINAILNLKDKFSSALQRTTGNTKKFERQVKKTQNRINKIAKSTVSAFGNIVKASATMAATAGVALTGIGINYASDLDEVQNVVDTTFGKMSKKVDEWSKGALEKFGLNELSAKRYSSTLGALMKSSGVSADKLVEMSTNLTGLAGDMASFYNLEPDVAFDKLRAAISGETEPMKALGVNMSVTNMEAFALTKGIKKQWKAMSQGEQTTLRYQYLMEKTADAQGDFNKTSDSFANQTKLMKENILQLAGSLSKGLLPFLAKMAKKLNDFIKGINVDTVVKNIQSGFEKAKNFISGFIQVLKKLLPIILGVIGGLAAFVIINTVVSMVLALKKAFNAASTATGLLAKANALLNVTFLTNPIFWIALAIGALIAIVIIAYQKCEWFRNIVTGLWEKFKEFASGLLANMIPVLQNLYSWFNEKIIPVIQKMGEILNWLWLNVLAPLGFFIGQVFQMAFVTAFTFIGTTIQNIAVTIGTVIDGLMSIFNGILEFIIGVFTGNWEQAWNGVKEIFFGIWTALGGIVTGILNGMIDGINAVIRGINSMLSFKVPDWIPVIGGKGVNVNIPTIPRFANGTSYFSGGLAQINERGGEIVDLPNGSRVIPADKSKKMLENSNGAIKVDVNIQGNVIGNKEFMEQTGAYVAEKIKIALLNS